MKKSLHILLMGAIILLMAINGIAQEEDFFWEIDVQVASSKSENIFNAPSSVSIVNQEMIQNYNFTSVAEAIQTVSGMSVLRTHLKRNLPTSRGILQDHYANKVLILINGIPSWNAVTGEGNLDRININDVERIEVLKGPASVLYGTNAYSGAVNIVLKESTEGQLNSLMGVGTNGSYQAGANYSATSGDLSYFVSANTSNLIQNESKFKGEDGYEALLREYMSTDNFTLQANYKSSRFFFNGFQSTESYLGVTPKFAGGAGNGHLVKGYLLNYTFDKDISDKFNLKLGANYDYGQRNLSRTLDDITRANIEGYRVTAFARGGYQISNAINLEVGATYDYRKSIEYKNYNTLQDTLVPASWTSNVDTSQTVFLDGNNGMNDKSLYEFSVFAQLGFVKNKFRALAGARYTNNELFGDDVSSRVTLSYAFSDRNSLKLIYGESFRSPSFFEQYFAYTTVLGNKDLKPEKSQTIELTYMTGVGDFFFQVLGYYGIYKNKIVRQKGDAMPFEGFEVENINIYQNGNEFSATGVELEVRYSNPKILNDIFLNFNYLAGSDGDIDENGSFNFNYVPEASISFGLTKNIYKQFGFSGLLNYWSGTNGSIKDQNGDFLKIDAQYYLDLNLYYRHELAGTKIKHTISAKNILDQDVLLPEYVRRLKLNEVSSGLYQSFMYTVAISL
ncbi:MAG: TonB-dependent receptor [Bacteroidales bacterium]